MRLIEATEWIVGKVCRRKTGTEKLGLAQTTFGAYLCLSRNDTYGVPRHEMVPVTVVVCLLRSHGWTVVPPEKEEANG